MSQVNESRVSIYAALVANLGIAVTKLVAAAWSGSSALLSEGVHSLVDTSNELLLLYGMHQAARRRTREHPLGHGRELYFWSFIVALLVFALGAGVSIYQGIQHLQHPVVNRHPWISCGVLAASALFDGYSFSVALRQFRRKKGELGYLAAIKLSKDPTSFAVLLEDAAALVGIAIALVGVVSAHLLRRPELDGLASIAIGGLLALTAMLMARECKALLIGESAAPELEASILSIVAADPAVARANGVLTFHLAPDQVVAALSAAFDNHLTAVDIEACVVRLEAQLRRAHPEVTLLFFKPQTSQAFAASAIVRELNQPDTDLGQ